MASSVAPKARGPFSAGRRGGAKPRKALGSAALARWWKVALLVVLVTVGLPLAHAMFGEVVAMLGGAMILGFLLGRWTAR
ncbi:hypothetical protein [Falsiroseomonas oryziterrae]|uniref:hypothetical protein n=1 Tax=Falsiroseomonas oryziterrae TaxID=2911368 RepID=UPI001F19B7DA|nr:hypothetical protein [Roseomonas sp. NPKOSM-4]